MSLIDDKATSLRASGLDLGSPTTQELDAGFGGFMREYQNGRIYRHPVMGREAHEVHGGIANIYIANGAHEFHPITGERRFGFPLTDEADTADALYRVSRFEFGAIFWREGVDSVYGAIYQRWKNEGSELGRLGHPVTGRFDTVAGQVQVFEGGLCGDAADVNSVAMFDWVGPQLGNPHIHPPSDGALEIPLFRPASPSAPGSASAFARVLETRVLLRPVAGPADGSQDVRLRLSSGQSEMLVATTLSPLTDRTLYNVCIEGPNGVVNPLALHAIYAKEQWHSFWLAHVTDTHIARRNDELPSRLRAVGRDTSRFNNFNDNFRDFVRFANRMHATGRLDLILHTGDLVDYVYEASDGPPSRGNFGVFEDILLGRSPYPERPEQVEELHVPIVTCLGNHDYRIRGYPLAFELELGSFDINTFDSTGPFNLDEADALALDGHNFTYTTSMGGSLFKVPSVHSGRALPDLDSGAAAAIAEVDDAMAHGRGYYFLRINRGHHTLLRLGIHRIALVDTRWDDGVISDLSTAFFGRFFSIGSPAQLAFLGGSPSSVGVDRDGVAVARQAVGGANALSIVIVGLHAPLFDIRDFRYFHYLRESEHKKTSRQSIAAFAGLMYSTMGTNYVVPSPWDHTGTPFFASAKPGSSVEFLDRNISEQGSQELMDICLGQGSARMVDLVLYGHGHHRVEFGLGYDPDKDQRLYFMDHYLGNPSAYYRSRAEGESYDVHVGSAATPIPTPPRGGSVSVPPYAEPLDAATDHADWWHDHRPVMCETAGLGPLEHRQNGPSAPPTFQGIRVFEIGGDVIRRAVYVPRAKLLDPGYI
jgi:hypothetical protein